jgi:hypothetical protein
MRDDAGKRGGENGTGREKGPSLIFREKEHTQAENK